MIVDRKQKTVVLSADQEGGAEGQAEVRDDHEGGWFVVAQVEGGGLTCWDTKLFRTVTATGP